MDHHQLEFHPEFCQKILCHSDTALQCGLNNECPPALLPNLSRLSQLLGFLCKTLNLSPNQLKINSGFRGHELNQKVGGVPHSQHCLGLAADVRAPDLGSPYELARTIEQSEIPFDQLILEYNRWVHISSPALHQPARRQALSIFSQAEGYLEGIVRR
jgi:zinc D-Ala-D-Ala carboxypeptidase